MIQEFKLGINYWPAKSAMYMWEMFNPQEIQQEFAQIREAGIDSVRFFMRWEDFQPTPDKVSEKALEQLVQVADIAQKEDLSIVPTLFTGHMSGANWIPPWALEKTEENSRFQVVSAGKVVKNKLKDWFADKQILEAQVLWAGKVAKVLKDHKAMWAYDLGNENSNCWVPKRREDGLGWLKQVTEKIRSADPIHPITIGMHMEDLEEDRKIGPAEAAQFCDFLCMHGYPINAKWIKDPTNERLLPFLGLITHWLGKKDVLFEEFGGPSVPDNYKNDTGYVLYTESEGAQYTDRALKALHEFGFMGGMLWCYADYNKSLWTKPPLDKSIHERYFGLWRADGSEKPAVAVVKQFSGKSRNSLQQDFSWIDIAKEDFYKDPLNNLKHLYQKFHQKFD